LLSHVLAHDINIGYHQLHMAVVEKINGHQIHEMTDVPRAFESPIEGLHVIELENNGFRADDPDPLAYGTRVVVDAGKATLATAEILRQHGVAEDRSPDLV
jgi:hypothetical protein